MKTVLQELISELKRVEDYPMMSFVIKTANDLLEKEKEQIIETFDNGIYVGTYAVDKDGEEYYNQTYNQTNVGNDGFEFDNSSTIPPPKTNNL
jgi:uncharacterized protein (DUF2164 family)